MGGPLFFMTYPFGVIKADLEKAFRLPDAPPLERPQKHDAAELSESELSRFCLSTPASEASILLAQQGIDPWRCLDVRPFFKQLTTA